MTVLLVVLGSMPRGVCLDPRFLFKYASPRLNAELPGLPLPIINAEIIAGVDGLGVGVATTVAAANIIVSKGVEAFASVGGGGGGNAQVAVSIDAENIVQVEASIGGVVGADISLTNGGSISIGGTKIHW
jgi:hypothetical protein